MIKDFGGISVGERVETIVQCFIRYGTTEGGLGKIVEFAGGQYRVETGGFCFIVERNPLKSALWSVRAGPIICYGDDVEELAREAFNTFKNASAHIGLVSKDYPL